MKAPPATATVRTFALAARVLVAITVATSRVAYAQSPAAGASPGAMSGHQMAYDASTKRVIVYSGVESSPSGNRYRSRLWAWDGAVWSLLASDGPPGRTDGQFVYDNKRSKLLLYGGRTFGARREDMKVLHDSWEWDGKSWRLVDSIGPGARMHAGMAYDGSRSAIVLFGGFVGDNDSISNDTWEWDGAHWTRRAAGPARRWVNALVASSNGVLLQAARRDEYDQKSSTAPGELWRWSGANWTQIDSSPRIDPQSPTVAMRDGFVFYAGWMLNQPARTWMRSTVGWKEIAGEQPPRRRGVAMAYDAARDRVVLFGGETDSGALADVWEFDGSAWHKRM